VQLVKRTKMSHASLCNAAETVCFIRIVLRPLALSQVGAGSAAAAFQAKTRSYDVTLPFISDSCLFCSNFKSDNRPARDEDSRWTN